MSDTSSSRIVSGVLVSVSIDSRSEEVDGGIGVVGGRDSFSNSSSLASLVSLTNSSSLSSSPSFESKCLGSNKHICNKKRSEKINFSK